MRSTDVPTRDQIREIYDRQAQVYDRTVWLYYLAGMRIGRWRRMAVDALGLRTGDTIVELGCGTGLNFSLLEQAVGETGEVIGIDISEAMLDRATRRVETAGWSNVTLVRSAASDYVFPEGLGGILATGVLTYEPEFDQVIARGAEALEPERRWVVLDYKMPNNVLRHLAFAFVSLGRRFGVSESFMHRRIWESMERHLENVRIRELYGGFVYIVSGEAPPLPKEKPN